MAMVGSRVQAMQDEDGNTVAVKTDVMVDPQSGLLVERKTVVAEVFSESGQHKAVLVGQQTNVTAVPVSGRPQYRAIEATPQVRRSTTSDDKCAIHCFFFIFSLCFPPLVCCWILYCCSAATTD